MQIYDGQFYELVEMEHALVIKPRDMTLREPHEKLVLCDAETLAEYLVRYLLARQSGKTLQEAHDQSLQGAILAEGGSANG